MNNNNMKTNEEYIEIDLREYIRTLWKNKWIIIALVIVAVLAAGLYSKYITKPKYKARATLIILPSTYKTSLELDTLPIDTYRSLAVTDSIKNKIIKEVGLRNDEGELYSPSSLDNMLSLKVQTYEQSQRNNGKSFEAPVIHLKVVNTDPELAAQIANSWSKNFMEDTKELRQGEVRDVEAVIQEQFTDTKEKLNAAKEELKNYKEKIRLEILKSELNSKKSKLDRYNNSIVNLKTDLGVEKAKYNHLKQTIRDMEKENNWDGELNSDILRDNKTEILTSSKEKYLEAQNKLLKFKKEHDVANLKKRISAENNKLLKYQKKVTELETLTNKNYIDKIISLKNELTSQRAQKVHLKEQLSKREENGKWIGDMENSNEKLEIKENYLDAQQKLLTYKENHDVDLLKLQISLDKNNIKQYKNKLSNLKTELEESKTENKEIKSLLEGEPDRWELKKSITNNALWDKILSPDQMTSIKNLELSDEIVSPIFKDLRERKSNNDIIINSYPKQIEMYQKSIDETQNQLLDRNHKLEKWNNEINKLKKDVTRYNDLYEKYSNKYIELKFQLEKTNIKINSLQNRIKYFKNHEIENIGEQINKYEELINKKRSTLNNLNTKLDSWNQTINNLKMDIDHYRKIYSDEASNYRKLKADKLDSEIKIDSTKSRLAFYEHNKKELLIDINKLQSKIWTAQNKKETLVQNVKDLQNTYDMLSSKVEEARLTQAEKTGDVRFIAEAITPSSPININSKLNIAIAAVLALFLGVFIVFFKEFMENDEEL